MGYTIDLESDDLWCKSEADAEAAGEIIAKDEWIHPHHLQVTPMECPSGDMQGRWFLEIEEFQGDHWCDGDVRLVRLAISPYMADGATIEFQGEGRERWLIRWEAGHRCHQGRARGDYRPRRGEVVMTLIVHRGGWEATKADLAAVPVPEPTESYHPVPYGRFVEEVELHVPRFGLKIQSEAFALAQEGNQMFGVLTCVNGKPAGDYALAIGIRSSYNRSLAVGVTAGGARCFVCDNLAFFGEVTAQRKHTVNVFRDLPDLIYRMLSQVSTMRVRTDTEIAAMKVRELPPAHAHHLMVEAVMANVLPASRLPKVIEAWEEPRHEEFTPRTAWSLFNAFTEVQKGACPRAQMEGSLRLSSLFRRELSLN